ncbi:helix-turn-helix domain-containing protein [Blautia obeum]
MQRWTRGEITAAAAMGLTGLSRTTFYRLAHQYKNGGLQV